MSLTMNQPWPLALPLWLQKIKSKCIEGCGRTVIFITKKHSGRCKNCAAKLKNERVGYVNPPASLKKSKSE